MQPLRTEELTWAVDKAADLEDDLRLYKTGSPSSPTSLQTPDNALATAQSRLTNFITARKTSLWGTRTPTPTNRTPTPQLTPTPTSTNLRADSLAETPLEEELAAERAAREAAEEKVASMTLELEELTQSLFEEANGMVKAEREKCARLEARLQIMESREEDKRRRLTELEKAVERITRVRSLLGEHSHAKIVSSVG
jgi:hypothetical protein